MRDSISENRCKAMEKDYCNPSLVSTGMLTCTWAHLHLPMHPHTCTHTGTCIYTHKRHDEWHFCCTQRTHKPAFGFATGHSRGRQPCSMYLRGNTRCICPVSLLFKFQWSCKLWGKCSFHWEKPCHNAFHESSHESHLRRWTPGWTSLLCV